MKFNIRNQKDGIEVFLDQSFGTEKAKMLYHLQQNRLKFLLSQTKGKTPSQLKTLTNTILPRVALFQIVREDNELCDQAECILEEYMCHVVSPVMHEKFLKAEKIPFFFQIFSRFFSRYMKKSDLWDCNITIHTKDKLGIDINKCLWYDACVENKCPELCRYFCMCDDIMYSGLSKFGFRRTQTLGMNGKKCDFVFYQKSEGK